MSKVCQLYSSSKGNCILISHKDTNILVDIGVTAKKCELALRYNGVEPADIDAIFVTHEHTDHAGGIRVFASRYHTPVYATQPCIDEMDAQGLINDKVTTYPMEYHTKIKDIEVISFAQSHDSVDCVGYRFNFSNGRSASVCTDTGYVTEAARKALLGTDLIFIESNHEVSMVEMGGYPYMLKKRILGERGHLSNFACGEFIKDLAQSGTTRFVLAHLSQENNMPHIARQTAISALSEIGLQEDVDYRLYVSNVENYDKGIKL